jgi:hypothetical protein
MGYGIVPGIGSLNCKGFCGGHAVSLDSSTECYCDSGCRDNGDCCNDAATACPEEWVSAGVSEGLLTTVVTTMLLDTGPLATLSKHNTTTIEV